MPRPNRLILPGQTHHIVQRGNNRQVVFFSDDDRQIFLKWLGEASAAEGCALHAYVLMTNHFHLVITAGEADSIPRLMQSLGRRYVSHVNREYGRTGTLWEGRYKSTILDSESYVLVCHRYGNRTRSARSWFHDPKTTPGRAIATTAWVAKIHCFVSMRPTKRWGRPWPRAGLHIVNCSAQV